MLDDFDRVLTDAQSGSGDAFTLIYEDLARPVATYLRTKGIADVEDLTSEVFLAIFGGIGGFRGNQAQFRSWVFTIVHRRVVDTWRRESRSLRLVPYDVDSDDRTTASAEASAMELWGQDRTLALLGTLTEDQREVLTLRIVGDLTIDEVAAVVGKQPGAVKALQRRALAALRRSLASEGVPL